MYAIIIFKIPKNCAITTSTNPALKKGSSFHRRTDDIFNSSKTKMKSEFIVHLTLFLFFLATLKNEEIDKII